MTTTLATPTTPKRPRGLLRKTDAPPTNAALRARRTYERKKLRKVGRVSERGGAYSHLSSICTSCEISIKYAHTDVRHRNSTYVASRDMVVASFLYADIR